MRTQIANATSANLAFSGLLFSVLSLALAEALNMSANAGVRRHAATAALGLLVFAVALRRARMAWPSLPKSKELPPGDEAGINLADAAACILLAIMGIALALLTLTASVTLFGIGALCISLTPWSRLAFCRHHCLGSCATVAICAACGLLFLGRQSDPLFLVMATWILSVIACVSVLCAAFSKVQAAHDMQRQEANTSAEVSLQGMDCR